MTSLTITKIQATSAEFFGISRLEILASSRLAKYAVPRQVAMYLARKLTSRSFLQIGQAFSRDHSTVMHACRKVQETPSLNSAADEIEMRLTQ